MNSEEWSWLFRSNPADCGTGRSAPSPCIVCGTTDVVPFVEISAVPIHCNVLWPTRDQALNAPRGDIRLGFCRTCGHIYNLAVDPSRMEYSQAYDNSLHFSPRFQAYAESLARRLIDRYDLHDKEIVEIGSGKGEFLRLLCGLGDNRGVGFDPSYVPSAEDGIAPGPVQFVQDFYTERYASVPADFVCCRHVLEHMAEPAEFLTSLRGAIGARRNTPVFFEMPNAMFMLRDLSIWDIIYEHCSYFSAGALSHLFGRCGFKVVELGEAFEGQFLYVEAWPDGRPAAPGRRSSAELDGVAEYVAAFADRYRDKMATWERYRDQLAENRQRAVIWGTGSKGVTFLNALEIRDQVPYAVDINPRKEGMYVAGTGQQIVPPEFLREYQPDTIIVMNPIYRAEIQQHTEDLGLAVEFLQA